MSEFSASVDTKIKPMNSRMSKHRPQLIGATLEALSNKSGMPGVADPRFISHKERQSLGSPVVMKESAIGL